MELTAYQNWYLKMFEYYIQRNQSKLFSSDERGWGKSTILKELSYTYQILGYKIYLLSSCPNVTKVFCDKYIYNSENIRGISRSKTIVIVDEYNYMNDGFIKVLEYCEAFDIPVVGFVNFNKK